MNGDVPAIMILFIWREKKSDIATAMGDSETVVENAREDKTSRKMSIAMSNSESAGETSPKMR